MDELQAKRRYKILRREQDRLREAGGRADAEMDAEIAKIAAAFPALAEAGPKPLSEGTAAMLRFAEAMAVETPDSAPAPAPALSAAAPAAPPKATPVAAPSPASPGPATAEPTVAASPTRRPTAPAESKTGGRAAVVISVVGAALRIANDVTARPTMAGAPHAKALLFAATAAVAHAGRFADPCGVTGRALDPLLACVMLHVQHAGLGSVQALLGGAPGGGGGANKPQRRWLVERVGVYAVRDLVPSLVTVFVTYTAVMLLCIVAGGEDRSAFCFD